MGNKDGQLESVSGGKSAEGKSKKKVKAGRLGLPFKLSKESLAIVGTTARFVEVLAVPGSGKTTAGVQRVTYLCQQMGVQPKRIQVLSFSNAAAGEFAGRLKHQGIEGVRVSTFHSFGADLLRRAVGQTGGKTKVIQKFDGGVFVAAVDDGRRVLEGVRLGANRTRAGRPGGKPGGGRGKLAQLEAVIDGSSQGQQKDVLRLLKWLDTKIGSKQFRSLYEAHSSSLQPIPQLVALDDFNRMRAKIKQLGAQVDEKLKGAMSGSGCGDVGSNAHAFPKLAAKVLLWLMERYRKRLLKAGLIDFPTMCVRSAKLLAGPKAPKINLQHLIVDEYQDCSAAQFKMLEALAAYVPNVMVLGDRKQQIYSFAGGTYKPLSEVSSTFSKTRLYKLSFSHRLTAEVAAFADTIPMQLTGADPKKDKVRTGKSGPVPTLTVSENDTAQAEAIARSIAIRISGGASPGQISVLARTNRELNTVESLLTGQGVPVSRSQSRHVLRVLTLVSLVESASLVPGRSKRHAVVDAEAVAKTVKPIQNPDEDKFIDLLKTLSKVRSKALEGKFKLCAKAYVSFLRPTVPYAQYKTVRNHLNTQVPVMRRFTSLGEAVEHIEKIGVERSTGAVTLSTAHGAKGREWPYVLVMGQTNGVWPIHHAKTAAAQEEERRLLYVAVTRSSATLELFCSPVELARPQAKFYEVSSILRPALWTKVLIRKRASLS